MVNEKNLALVRLDLVMGVGVFLLLIGCSTQNPDITKPSFAGSGSLISQKDFQDINLCNLLVSFGLAEFKAPNVGFKSTESVPRIFFDKTEKIERLCIIKSSGPNVKVNRNSFVGFGMALSEAKCGVYEQELLRARAERSRDWLTASILFAGTASVIEHARTAASFAAGSAVASGGNAVAQQEQYANLATEIITAGIRSRRKEIYDAVILKYDKSETAYPVGNAVRDVLAYHAACTAVTGLEVAKDSISRVDNPGLSQMIKQFKAQGYEFGVTLKKNPVPKKPDGSDDADGSES